MAIDGSYHESEINEQLPSTRIGFVKVGCILVDMGTFASLKVLEGRYVDPFRVAELQENNSALTFALPSANVRWGNRQDVRTSFRAALDAHLYGPITRFVESDPKTSLRTTLFHLASRRPKEIGTGNDSVLKLHKCPECEKGPIEVRDIPDPQFCPHCHGEIYPSDCLRIWEEVSEYQSNVVALSRSMLAIEHMMPVHYIRYLAQHSFGALGATTFFVDGPLAVFGTPAWLHAALMRYLSEINTLLMSRKLPQMIMIGLQKTGQVVDHVRLIDRFLPANRIYAVDDDYRYQHILMGRDPAHNGFGFETYYGQDFIYKTESERTFVFALPYPFASKESGKDFIRNKTNLSLYPQLSRALALIHNFESDLYENAVVPIALAHRYTSISLVPGGKVLDIMMRQAFQEALAP